jgi:hypothetical protein
MSEDRADPPRTEVPRGPDSIRHLTVGVVVERRVVDSPWIDHMWLPVAVLSDAPEVPPFTSLGETPGGERFYLGAAQLALYPSDTGHMRDNFLAGPAPQVWVSIRPTGIDPPLELVGVSADPFEGEAFTEGMGDIVEPVPMPADLAAEIAAYVDAHHVERVFVKRKRDRARTDAFDRAPGGPKPEREP